MEPSWHMECSKGSPQPCKDTLGMLQEKHHLNPHVNLVLPAPWLNARKERRKASAWKEATPPPAHTNKRKKYKYSLTSISHPPLLWSSNDTRRAVPATGVGAGVGAPKTGDWAAGGAELWATQILQHQQGGGGARSRRCPEIHRHRGVDDKVGFSLPSGLAWGSHRLLIARVHHSTGHRVKGHTFGGAPTLRTFGPSEETQPSKAHRPKRPGSRGCWSSPLAQGLAAPSSQR
mgnify:CR=1 FL=1